MEWRQEERVIGLMDQILDVVESIPQLIRSLGTPIGKSIPFQFDGNPNQLARFLVSVSLFAQTEGVTMEELFKDRVHLFTGDALDWVLTSQVTTWDELRTELIHFVHGSRTHAEQLDALAAKKQGTEKSTVFINRMLLEMSILKEPLDNASKVQLILNGVRPDVRLKLLDNRNTITVNELRDAAMMIDKDFGSGHRTRGFTL